MKRWIVTATVLGLLCGTVSAQDEGKTEALDQAEDAVRESLVKSMDKGGVVVSGSLERESPFGQMGVVVGGLGGGEIEGDFTARVGKNGAAVFVVDSEKGRLEVFRKAERTVQRQTWSGSSQPGVGDFAKEVSRLLDLRALKSYLRNAKNFKEEGEKDVGGRACRVVQGAFPAGLLEDDEDEDPQGPMQFKLKLFEVRGIKARFYIDKEDGTLRKLKMDVTKGYSSAIRLGAPGMEGEEEPEGEGEGHEQEGDDPEKDPEDGPPGMPGFDLGQMKFVNSYTFTVDKYDPDLSVEIPEELQRFFEE